MANPEHLKILKQGVEVWNRWRINHYSDDQLDFTGATLNNIDLEGAFLEKSNFEKTDLRGANLIEAKINESVFIEAYLRDANLSNAHLYKSDFTEADLTEAILYEADIRLANLSDSILTRTSFVNSDLSGANLYRAKIRDANFENCKLINANLSNSQSSGSNFKQANLSKTNFTGSDLIGANFTSAKLQETDFTDCILGGTIFALTNLSTCIGLDEVGVSRPCIIDFHTLQVSSNLSRSFLTKIGLPELFIDYLPEFRDSAPIRMYPVFLSHAWKNKDFARKLYEALIARGVTVFFDEKNMKPGDEITERLTRGIDLYDKMLLVCSKESLESPWVDRELNRILRKEDKHFTEQKRKVNLLIPITIDDHVFQWDGAKADDVRRYIIGDFRDWQDNTKFEKALEGLIHALNVDRVEDVPKSYL
ncbi:MAG: toll/interleukin-1 receptor domain-containing protein [Phycisphaerae bacterium]|nr:toll/interleukin-1 receptor domain-containing protein [Saprospiraceae bacterium]